MARWLVGVVAVVLATGAWTRGEARSEAALRPPAPALLVRVVEGTSQQPLPNAEVIDLDSGARRFTNGAGETRIAWPEQGRLRLRVRQLGFQFMERELTQPSTDAALDTATFALSRVAYVLPDVATRATSACATEGDSVAKLLSVVALGQLRMGAERYDAFRKAYPFQIRQNRRTVRFHPNGTARQIREETEQARSDDWGERYRPGRVIDRRGGNFTASLLFLSALGDSVFWAHHCFTVHGVETLGPDRVLRLAFTPAPSVKTIDWMGTALLDSATSVLRRVEFQMAGLRETDVPRRLEGYTTFRSPSPFIVIPDSTVAMWWRRDLETSTGDWGGPDVMQLLQLLEVKYRKARPPGATQP